MERNTKGQTDLGVTSKNGKTDAREQGIDEIKMKGQRKTRKQTEQKGAKCNKVNVNRSKTNLEMDWMTKQPKPGKEDERITREGKEWAWCELPYALKYYKL